MFLPDRDSRLHRVQGQHDYLLTFPLIFLLSWHGIAKVLTLFMAKEIKIISLRSECPSAHAAPKWRVATRSRKNEFVIFFLSVWRLLPRTRFPNVRSGFHGNGSETGSRSKKERARYRVILGESVLFFFFFFFTYIHFALGVINIALVLMLRWFSQLRDGVGEGKEEKKFVKFFSYLGMWKIPFVLFVLCRTVIKYPCHCVSGERKTFGRKTKTWSRRKGDRHKK